MSNLSNTCRKLVLIGAVIFFTNRLSGHLSEMKHSAYCKGFSYSVVLSTRDCAPPTIALGSAPVVCPGALGASVHYSATTNSPNEYRIDFADSSFTDVPWSTLNPDSIVFTIPSGTPSGSYSASLYVRNATDCESNAVSFSLTIRQTPNVSITGDATVCPGSTPPLISFTNPLSLPVTAT